MKTFEDIEKLGLHDKTVYSCLKMISHGTCTKEQALINMVLLLAEQKNEYFNEVVKLHQNAEPKRGGLLNPDGGNYPLKWMTEPAD